MQVAHTPHSTLKRHTKFSLSFSVVLSFNVANFNLFENKLRVTGDKLEDKKNNTEKLVEKEFLIIGSVKKYDDALKLANDAKNKLGYSLDLRDLEEDKIKTKYNVAKESILYMFQEDL